MRYLFLSLIAALSIAPLHAQSLRVTGEATNLGTSAEPREPLTGALTIASGGKRPSSPYLTVGHPLGGSGPAQFFCWSDSMLIVSMSAEGDTIAWLGSRSQRTINGEYAIVGGQFTGQGGIWWLATQDHDAEQVDKLCGGEPRKGVIAAAVQITQGFRQRRPLKERAFPEKTHSGVSVTGIGVGAAFDPSTFSLARHTAVFGPTDTMYVLVETQGTVRSAISARWEYHSSTEGTSMLVDYVTQVVEPDGPAQTEFHVFNPRSWPVGTYSVTILADDDTKGTLFLSVAY